MVSTCIQRGAQESGASEGKQLDTWVGRVLELEREDAHDRHGEDERDYRDDHRRLEQPEQHREAPPAKNRGRRGGQARWHHADHRQLLLGQLGEPRDESGEHKEDELFGQRHRLAEALVELLDTHEYEDAPNTCGEMAPW